MTTKNSFPALEDLLGAEKMELLKTEIAKIASETYQPLLDSLGKRLHFNHTKAEVSATVELLLVEEENGNPTVSNHVSLGVTFTPAHTYDPFEEANRVILASLFARTLQK